MQNFLSFDSERGAPLASSVLDCYRPDSRDKRDIKFVHPLPAELFQRFAHTDCVCNQPGHINPHADLGYLANNLQAGW